MGKAHEALISVTVNNIDHARLGLTIGIKPPGRYIQMRVNVLKIKLIHLVKVALKCDKVFIVLRQIQGMRDGIGFENFEDLFPTGNLHFFRD